MTDERHTRAWKAKRAALLPLAYGKPCPGCGVLMTRDMPLELDHEIPVAYGGTGGPSRIVCRPCNRRSGAWVRQHLPQNGPVQLVRYPRHQVPTPPGNHLRWTTRIW